MNDSNGETVVTQEQNIQMVFRFLVKGDFVLVHRFGRPNHCNANLASGHDVLFVDDRTDAAWVSSEGLLDADIVAIDNAKLGVSGWGLGRSTSFGNLVPIMRSSARFRRTQRNGAVDRFGRVELQLEKAHSADTAVVFDGGHGSATVSAGVEALFEVQRYVSPQFSTRRRRRSSAR